MIKTKLFTFLTQCKVEQSNLSGIGWVILTNEHIREKHKFLLGRIVVYIWLQWYCYRISIHDIYRKISTARCSWTVAVGFMATGGFDWNLCIFCQSVRLENLQCPALQSETRCQTRINFNGVAHGHTVSAWDHWGPHWLTGRGLVLPPRRRVEGTGRCAHCHGQRAYCCHMCPLPWATGTNDN